MREVQEGDPKYLAPEVLVGSHNITKAVDVFSLGMSILELATDLDLPRGGEPWHKLRNGQLPDDLTAGLSSQLIQIICRMIEPDHKKRPDAHCLLADVHVKRRMCQQKRQEVFQKVFEKLKKSLGYFYAILQRDLIRPLKSGCRFLFTGLNIFYA